MKIIWHKSGDYLLLDPINDKLVEFWINKLNESNQNYFSLIKFLLNPNSTSVLASHIKNVHDILDTKFKIDCFEPFLNADLLDQKVLNMLHRVWVKIQIKHPNLPNLILKISDNLFFDWNQINKKLHHIEKSFEGRYKSPEHGWENKSPFDNEILSFDRCNFSIKFTQKGRNSYNKWEFGDNNRIDIDTNDYLEIGAEVNFNAHRPLNLHPPTNYIDYCNRYGYPIVGNYLNLANFYKYDEDLTNIRHVLIRNLLDENNTALFEF